MRALYGTVKLQREYCHDCECWAFIIDGKFACCDSPRDRNDNTPKRMSKALRRNLTIAQRKTIILDQDNKCFYCGAEFGSFAYHPKRDKLYRLTPQIDHIYPYILGGGMDRQNLVASCAICNILKRAHIRATFAELKIYLREKWQNTGYIHPIWG